MAKIIEVTNTLNIAAGVTSRILLLVLIVLLTAILPYRFPPDINDKIKEEINKYSFYGDEDGCPDRVALIESTTDGFSSRIELIRSAKERLDIVYHSIGDGDVPVAFLSEAYLAADRGVNVRLLIDKIGTSPELKIILRLFTNHPNIECRVYNELDLMKPYGWNVLLHDKFILVDNEFLLLGGRNIEDKYFAPNSFNGKISRDRDALIWNTSVNTNYNETQIMDGNGTKAGKSVIDEVNSYMDMLWNADYNRYLKPIKLRKLEAYEGRIEDLILTAKQFEADNPEFYDNGLEVYLKKTVPAKKISLIYNPLNNKANEPWVGYIMGNLALKANESVIIQTPYATGNSKVIQFLNNLSERIPSVSMLTNSLASSPNFPAFSNYYTQREKFIKTGIDIYEYQSTDSIHGKSMVIDGNLSAVGSFNLDDRSLFIDTETMLIIDSQEFAKELTDAMKVYKEQSLLVGDDNGYVLESGKPVVNTIFAKKALMIFTSIFSRLFQFLI